MPKYNLDALGAQEFERLCQSLVQQIIGQGAKVYGMGSDGAREATFHGKAPYPSKEEQWGGSWIFQAKFHDVQQIGPKKARKAFAAELKDELSKITEKYRHPCDNFILMTNVSLTPVFQRGMKDRYTMLSDLAIETLSRYLKTYHPEKWLFPGQKDGMHITTRTVQRIFEDAIKKEGIDKDVSVHSLRHSFATPLLESGVDLIMKNLDIENEVEEYGD